MTWFAGTTIGRLTGSEGAFAPWLNGGFCGTEPDAFTDGGCEPSPQPRVSPNDAATMSARSSLGRQGLIDSSYKGYMAYQIRLQRGCQSRMPCFFNILSDVSRLRNM